MKYTVVIPAYNEAGTIETVVREILSYSQDIIVVNDGSHDETGMILDKLPIKTIQREKNCGKAYSLWEGAREAIDTGADYILTMDADGQHAAEAIPSLLSMLQQHPGHIIIGSRRRNVKNAPKIRRFANHFANFWISWAAGYPISDTQSGFRLYPKEIFMTPTHPPDKNKSFVFESEVLIDAVDLGVYSIAVDIDAIYPKQARHSHYQAYSDTAKIVKMVAAKLYERRFSLKKLARSLKLIPLNIKR